MTIDHDTAQTSFPTDWVEAKEIASAVLHMPKADALAYLERRMTGPLGEQARETAKRIYINMTDTKE